MTTDLETLSEISQAAVVGGGVIGGGWAARLVLNGIDVRLFDPSPDAERRVNEVVENADCAHSRLTLAPATARGRLEFVDSVAQAVTAAGFIQESVPERLSLKQSILGEIDAHAPSNALICSSTSGLMPTKLQAHMAHPERMMVGHPFNPVYLLPLVEICGGVKTSMDSKRRAAAFYESIGMRPLILRKEIDAFIADRIMEAYWREALWLVNDGVATVEEIDDAIRYGAGLRWAIMGTFQVYRVAGGEGGMRHFVSQFAPSLKWPWTKLTDVPELTDELVDRIAEQSDEQARGLSIRDLERKRDDCLVSILQALRGHDWGAGAVLKAHESRIYARAHRSTEAEERDLSKPLNLLDSEVRPDWVDYNGHMTESRYLQVFGDATDAFLRFIGMDAAYLAGGNSVYTVETHIRHLREVQAGEPLALATQLLGHDAKRIRIVHVMTHGREGYPLATAEHMLLHVDTHKGAACPMGRALEGRIERIWEGHQSLASPDHAGRGIRSL